MTADKPLVVTAGEPAGIGPELCVSMARQDLPAPLIVISDPGLLRSRAQLTGIDIEIVEIRIDDVGSTVPAPGQLQVIKVPFPETVRCGQPSPANAEALLDGLRMAVDGCLAGRFSGLVTAPLQKSVINDAGFAFTGHTEFLAGLTGTPLPVMLLTAGELRVALASTHMPLRDVPDYLDRNTLLQVLRVLLHDLETKFGIDSPEVVVCGLNPHAGEAGHLGSEDAEIIAPVIEILAAEGHRVRGPLPADTAFTPAAGRKDAVLAMYHDQGLPVVKYAGFGNAVNVTLGLPIIRTSVDHGTALDLAGKGAADPGSLRAAIELASELAAR